MSSTGISERNFGYTPNYTLALAAAVVYAIVQVALLLRVIRSKAWWALCLPIGASFEAVGFFLRYLSKRSPNSTGLFAIEQLFIICAPAAFLAFNYITYGRLISHVGSEHSVINPQKVAKIFVFSDIFTFLLQAGGSGLETTDKLANTGQTIVLVGLILQALSYGFFCIILIKSHISIRSDGGSLVHKSITLFIRVMYISSAFISIRCIYRVIEFAQGRKGYLLSHEVFLYVLDALPLILAIMVYIPWWPTNYIQQEKREDLEMSMGIRP